VNDLVSSHRENQHSTSSGSLCVYFPFHIRFTQRSIYSLSPLQMHDNISSGMMFQLVLTDKLKSHLQKVSTSQPDRPIMHPASQPLMNRIPDYYKSSYADNIGLFHGREIRRVPNANGGMGFVLQLSYADPTTFSNKESNDGKAVDPQGWSSEEITTYDGWRGDTYRKWRNAATYVDEGFDSFSSQFGNEAYGLNHRFYLHLDNQNRMWLSAEDGCEGTPKDGSGGLLGKLGGFLFG
jgi:hypothetical protein